jgi:Virus neck protein
MATNFYFNNFQASGEQSLLENLIIEAIKMYGEDMIYIPRNIGKLDQLYTSDDQSYYKQTYDIEMYIKSVDGFSGDGNFMSKFGLEIRDQVIFSVSQRIFSQEIGAYTAQVRPNEGDLIYFPLNKKCFQIKFVNKFEMFYQLGTLQTWEMTCELFEYADELMETGIQEIDSLQTKYSTNELDYALRDTLGNLLQNENGDFIMNENYNLDTIIGTGTNDVMANESNGFIDFSQVDPFSEGHF